MIKIFMRMLWNIEMLSNIVLMICETLINWLIVLPGVLIISLMLYLVFPFFLLSFIHYSFHPLTSIETFWDSIIVAFSFVPWVIGAYLGECWDKIIEPDDKNEIPSTSFTSITWLAASFVLVYLFRAITLFFDISFLSDWSQIVSEYTVKLFEYFYALFLN